MTKKILSFLIAATLLLGVCVTAFAADEDVVFSTMVVDIPDVLDETEETQLNDRAWEITQKYGCAVYILISDTLEGYEAWEYNEALHRELSLGYGEEKSAVILLLSMQEREYDLMAHGYGNIAFTDYGKDVMAQRFLGYFANDDWYGGFDEYLISCEEFLALAANGTPFDVNSDRSAEDMAETSFVGVVIAVLLSCVISLVICLTLRAQMKTAHLATEAKDYEKKLVLTKQFDRFAYRDVQRVYNPPQEESKGGTIVNSSGSSHKSGRF